VIAVVVDERLGRERVLPVEKPVAVRIGDQRIGGRPVALGLELLAVRQAVAVNGDGL
jgi:hypothetical protein